MPKTIHLMKKMFLTEIATYTDNCKPQNTTPMEFFSAGRACACNNVQWSGLNCSNSAATLYILIMSKRSQNSMMQFISKRPKPTETNCKCKL